MAKKFNLGDKVFAKVRGYPPWPAKVVGLADAAVNKMRYHVSFYGTGETAMCKVEDLFSYVENKEKYGKPLKRKGFNEAIAEVEQILSGAVTEKPTPAPRGTVTPASAPTEAKSTGGAEDADSDHEFALVIDETPQHTTPTTKQSRSSSTDERKKAAMKRKRESEGGTEHDTEAKRAKRGSVQSTRKSASNNSESSVKSSEPSVTAAVGPSANSSVPSSVTQSSPKQELVSRSGRKIKPKKFLDEESFEGGPAGGSEVNGSPKTVATPKASADGEGKQGSLRASKRLSVKGSTAALQSEHSSPAAADEQLEICMGVVKSEPGSDTNGVPVPVTFEPENNEGDKSHQEDVMVFILNALECPACHEIVTVPVLQCERGHHVCNDCWKQVVSCPLCKRPRSEAHNYVAEAVLEKLLFPCKYRADGCAEVMYQVDKAAHEKMCLFRTFTCLVDDCNQAYSVSEIVQHLKSAHCYLITGSRFCVRKGLKFSFTLCQFTFQSLVHAFFIPGWGLFYLCHKVSWQNTCLWLQMIGRGALNTDFLYSVEVSDKLRSVAYQGPVVLMHADTSQQPNECLVITDISLAALRKSTEFCIKVSIWESNKDVE